MIARSLLREVDLRSAVQRRHTRKLMSQEALFYAAMIFVQRSKSKSYSNTRQLLVQVSGMNSSVLDSSGFVHTVIVRGMR